MKHTAILIIVGILLFGCKKEKNDRYAYYNPSGHVIKECANEIPKIGDVLPSYYNGVVIEVNIHGERKGSISNFGIPYAPQTIDPGSEDLTYIYYDYVVKTDTHSPEYAKLYEEYWGKPLTRN